MKLIVQIPCLNEAATLPRTVADVPRRMAGIDDVELLVIDDGSTDETVTVAAEAGVDPVVRHPANRGLAAAFATGIDAALRLGADVIVNTDADNQYCGGDIARLVAPIVSGEADVVVGDRQTDRIMHFSRGKKLLQRIGSFLVRRLSGTNVPDAVSGFRAYSREAALRINVVSTFSYTIETLIQAGAQGLRIVSVPVRTNPPTRPSRLSRGTLQFLRCSGVTMLRAFAMYHPLAVFVWIGLLLFVLGAVPIARFLVLFALYGGAGHVQSLLLGGVLVMLGGLVLMMGILADLIAANRRLIERMLATVRRLEFDAAARSQGAQRDACAHEGQLLSRRQVLSERSDDRAVASELTERATVGTLS